MSTPKSGSRTLSSLCDDAPKLANSDQRRAAAEYAEKGGRLLLIGTAMESLKDVWRAESMARVGGLGSQRIRAAMPSPQINTQHPDVLVEGAMR